MALQLAGAWASAGCKGDSSMIHRMLYLAEAKTSTALLPCRTTEHTTLTLMRPEACCLHHDCAVVRPGGVFRRRTPTLVAGVKNWSYSFIMARYEMLLNEIISPVLVAIHRTLYSIKEVNRS